MKTTKIILVLLVALSTAMFAGCDGDDGDNIIKKIVKKRPKKTWYVDVDAVGKATGKSWANAFNDVQSAIVASRRGDRIFVADGVYTETDNFPVGFPTNPVAQMKDGVNIFGGFVGTEAKLSQRGDPSLNPSILDGEMTSYHVVVGASDARLDGFLVRYGYAFGMYGDAFGGGMLNDTVENLNVSNCDFYYNDAYYAGGGMINLLSSLTISNTVFVNNSSRYGGGGMFNYYSSPSISDSGFSKNSAFEATYNYGAGGGMLNSFLSSPTISDTYFIGNTSLAGGGMFNYYHSDPDISGAAFSANTAIAPDVYYAGGGWMYNYESSPTISDSIFKNNYCYSTFTGVPPYFGYGGGAGIFNRKNSSPTISDTVFTNNTGLGGSGIFNLYSSSPNISNAVFRDNYGLVGAGMFNGISSSPTINNALFVDNITYYPGYGAGVGGGMTNVYSSSPKIYNATFSGNYASWGGGIANYYGSNPIISDSIMWNNTGTSGVDEEIFNPVIDPVPCVPVVTYSDIGQAGYAGVNGNISNDPLFVGDYFLSQIAAGQGADSPALNLGNPLSPIFGTTRTDGVADAGVIDMGYHHPIP